MTACGEVAKDGRQEKNRGGKRMKERLMKQQAQICLSSTAGERHCVFCLRLTTTKRFSFLRRRPTRISHCRTAARHLRCNSHQLDEILTQRGETRDSRVFCSSPNDRRGNSRVSKTPASSSLVIWCRTYLPPPHHHHHHLSTKLLLCCTRAALHLPCVSA